MSFTTDTDRNAIASLAAKLAERFEKRSLFASDASSSQRVHVYISSQGDQPDWSKWYVIFQGMHEKPYKMISVLNFDFFAECNIARRRWSKAEYLFHYDFVTEPLEPLLVACSTPTEPKTTPSLAEKATRMLLSGDIVDFRPPITGTESERAAIISILDTIERNTLRGETIDELDDQLQDTLAHNPTLAPLLLFWLKQKKRKSLLVWYLLDLLQGRTVDGLDDYALDLLAQKEPSEEALGALQALRRMQLTQASRHTLTHLVFEMLDGFKRRQSIGEGSIDEKMLAELIDAAGDYGSERTTFLLHPLWSRSWTFKIRLRAMSAIQSIISKNPRSPEVENFIRATWPELLNMILSLVESYTISHTTRALMYKAIELYVVRLGPECSQVKAIITRAPELSEQLHRSMNQAEIALSPTAKMK